MPAGIWARSAEPRIRSFDLTHHTNGNRHRRLHLHHRPLEQPHHPASPAPSPAAIPTTPPATPPATPLSAPPTTTPGRLKTLTNGAATETSIYNARGQRIQISGGVGGTVLYAYDEAGHLLGEYGATGTLIQETVWLGDIPVATLRPSGSAVSIYYVHSDQLNTPRQVTRPSDNAAMWTWNSDPFGTDAANASPSGAGVFNYNLRFPGQIFDGQAGLHQNGFRDYDPAIGRFSESDPLGLMGGSYSLYPYVNGQPIMYSDPSGSLYGGGYAAATGAAEASVPQQ